MYNIGDFLRDVEAGSNTMRSGNGDIPGRTEQVKPELDKAMFGDCIWQEAGKRQSSAASEVMKRTKHQYHYELVVQTVLLKLRNYFIISTVHYTVAYRLMIMSCVRLIMLQIVSTSNHITVIRDINNQCIHKLKPGKDDGDLGFKSDHIINGSHRLHLLLSLWYNLMLLLYIIHQLIYLNLL